jgi:uncharacterized membrane protein YvbJ
MVKFCWNCGHELHENEVWCGGCGRLQNEDTPVVLSEGDTISVRYCGTLTGMALEVNNRLILPASSKGIRIILKREAKP